MPFLDSSPVRLHYRVDGLPGAPVLVLSHSLGADLGMWEPQVALLAREHRVVRYDARGCGLSDREAAQDSFATNLVDLEAVVGAAGLQRFALFGASQGAAIAIEYAARHPQRVSHLILCGGYLRGVLKRGGFLTRDSRVVERKKYGRAKARRSFQFSKR